MTTLVPSVPKNAPADAQVPALIKTAPKTVPAALQHVQAAQSLMGHAAARMLGNGMTAAALTPQALNPDTWSDLLQMQQAVVKRLQLQQQSWTKGCTALMEEYAQLKNANTLPKLVGQQFNLAMQWGFLVSNQMTSLMELEENIEVDYAYWASQKLQEQAQ